MGGCVGGGMDGGGLGGGVSGCGCYRDSQSEGELWLGSGWTCWVMSRPPPVQKHQSVHKLTALRIAPGWHPQALDNRPSLIKKLNEKIIKV